MTAFVRTNQNSEYKNWGVAKLIDVDDVQATVSWFDSPLRDPRTEVVSKDSLIPVTLDRQTRVYWLDKNVDCWRVGRVLDADDMQANVRFSNLGDVSLPVSALEVRWDRPIEDPSAFLGAQLNESPQFAQARTQFAKTMVEQRGACSGMSALLSSIIDLEQHQYEVVKRVLMDPVQRYLLADEVGLGKTIEAGVLIRQFLLDHSCEEHVLVLVPEVLQVQWRRELRKRFLLGDMLDENLTVLPLSAPPTELLSAVGKSYMVVIDEAHHLSRDPVLYAMLREAIIDAPRLLLLSATPVLHNERGFLEMLHLLDPHVFRLEDASKFKQRIEHRQTLAESVAGLIPENCLGLDDFIDDLTERFPDDELLCQLSEELCSLLLELPDETDERLVDSLRKLRAHLTETYRLDRRILRNRRRDLPFLTPDRSGLQTVSYSSADIERLFQAMEAWRNAAAEVVYGKEDGAYATFLSEWFITMLTALLSEPNSLGIMVQNRIGFLDEESVDSQWEKPLLIELGSLISHGNFQDDCFAVLVDLVSSQLKTDAKIVVFCSDSMLADAVTEFLQKHISPIFVDRHLPHEDPEEDSIRQLWESFLDKSDHRVLVCDESAEEGVNLQGGEKIIIHLDLPLAPNRIEQRLGRVDRYGSGNAIRSFALICEDNPYAKMWSAYLDKGLGLFDRSVASLQYLIESEMQKLSVALLFDGVEAFETLTETTGGVLGTAERELRRIDDQDALDALTLNDEEPFFDALTDVDSNWQDVAESVQQWMVDILQIEKETSDATPTASFGFGVFRFCFLYGDRGRTTLIPLKRILSTMLQFLDLDAPGSTSKSPKTGWYSCRRATAIGSSAPSEGVRLVRWGESLVDQVQKITDVDDRGRASAMWRHHRGYVLRSELLADTFVRFDFIVDTDVSRALADLDIADDSTFEKALERRGDMALAPFYKTVWLDEDLSLVTDLRVLEILESSYERAPCEGSHQDWNLNAEVWPQLDALGLRTVDVWQEWVSAAKNAAEQVLRIETNLEELCNISIRRSQESNESIFAQLRARGRHSESSGSDSTLVRLSEEKRIADALHNAIKEPRITIGTVAAVFVSPHALSELTS